MNNNECSRVYIDLAFVNAIRINSIFMSRKIFAKFHEWSIRNPIISRTCVFTWATADFAKQYAETIGVN